MSNILNGTIQTNGLGYVKANVDGIEFNKIKGKSKSTLTANPTMPASNGNLWKANTEDLSAWTGINAVDIDWNGAQVEENVIINTTGELLNWIKTKGGQIPRPAGCSALADVPSDLQSDGHEYQHLQCARKRKPMVCAYGQMQVIGFLMMRRR